MSALANSNFWLMVRLSRTVRRWIPAIVVLLAANTVFGSVSILLVLPVLEYIGHEQGGHGVAPAGGALAGQGAQFLPVMVNILAWTGVEDIFLGLCALIVLAFLLKAGFSVLMLLTNAVVAERLRLHWLDRCASRYLYAPYAAIAAEKQGVVANNIIREPTEASRYVKLYIDFLTNCALALAIVGSMILVEWRIVAFFGVLTVLLMVLMRKVLFGFSMRIGERNIALSQQIVGYVHETASSMKEIRVLGAERLRLAGILDIMRRLARLHIKFQVLKDLPRSLGEFVVVTIGIGVLVGVYFSLQGDLASILPKLAFFALALSRLFALQTELVSQRVTYVNKIPSVRLVLDLMEDPRLEAEQRDPKRRRPIERLETDIVFDRVGFDYGNGVPVLEEVSLAIPRGKLTYVLGSSGVGKSTLLDLLARLYTPVTGAIRCNGGDIGSLDLAQWRARLGYVAQDCVLFNGSIRDNIQVGRPGVSEDDIAAAARMAGIEELIKDKPEGWDTLVGDRGLELSGGQRKRIAIARALAGRPDLLLFDEATTSFEETLEREILNRIRQERPQVTIVLITHRLSSARHADRIHVLEAGRVVASGSYDDIRQTAERLLSQGRAPAQEAAVPGGRAQTRAG